MRQGGCIQRGGCARLRRMANIDPMGVPVEDFDERIKALEEQLDEQTALVELTQSRLEWFRKGRDLFPKNSTPATSIGAVRDVGAAAPSGSSGDAAASADLAATLRAGLNGS